MSRYRISRLQQPEAQTTIATSTELVAYWIEKLRKESEGELDENGEKKLLLPLAPFPIRHKTVITYKDYQEYLIQNFLLGEARSRYVEQEIIHMLNDIGTMELRYSLFMVIGSGLARGWRWMIELVKHLEMKGVIWDLSPVGIENGEQKVEELGIGERVEFWNEEFRGVEYEIDANVFLVVVFQFLQIVKPAPERLISIGREIGRHIGQGKGRRVIIAHPFPEDNVGVEWQDTVPYTWEEILGPIQQGADCPIQVVRPYKVKYYKGHDCCHTYTLFTIMAA